MASQYAIGFLINPVSGGGLGARVYSHLPEIMASFGYADDTWKAFIIGEDDAAQKTQYLLQCSKKIIAVGGDGTIGLVLNQLRMNQSEAEIGLLPLGTGNDLGRTLGIYDVYRQRGLLACVKRLIKASYTEFDLWSVNQSSTLAAYISIGMDAAILHDFDDARKRGKIPRSTFWYKLYYLSKFFYRMKYNISRPIRLKMNLGSQDLEVSLQGLCCCLIGNISSYSGGAYPFDKNKFNDGKLDIICFKGIGPYLLQQVVSRISPYCYKWMTKRMQIYQAYSVSLINMNGEFIQLDGEDISKKFKNQDLEIKLSRKVRLLDLRKAPFEVF
jgi:diacylglycerol kinase family enzyme